MTAHDEGPGLCARLLGSCAPVLCNHKTESKTYLHKQLKNHIYPGRKSIGTSSRAPVSHRTQTPSRPDRGPRPPESRTSVAVSVTTPERCQEPQSPRTAPSMPLSMQLLTGSASPLTALTPPKLASFSCPIQKPPHSPRAKLFFSCLRSSSQAPLAVIHFYRTRLRPILGPSRPPPPPHPPPQKPNIFAQATEKPHLPKPKIHGDIVPNPARQRPGLAEARGLQAAGKFHPFQALMTAHAEGQGQYASMLGSCAPVLCSHNTVSKTYLHKQLRKNQKKKNASTPAKNP